MIFRSFIYLPIYLLVSFIILSKPCKLNLLSTSYIFMFYQCCILCTPERKYILDIRRFINTIITINNNTAPGRVYTNYVLDSGMLHIVGMYERVTDLKKTRTSLKVLLAVGGWNMGSPNFTQMVSTAQTRSRFIEHAIGCVRVSVDTTVIIHVDSYLRVLAVANCALTGVKKISRSTHVAVFVSLSLLKYSFFATI